MKKLGLFLMAMALAITALLFQPTAAMADPPFCLGAACLIGPRCCSVDPCIGFCHNLNPNSIPRCSGDATESGCCSCDLDDA